MVDLLPYTIQAYGIHLIIRFIKTIWNIFQLLFIYHRMVKWLMYVCTCYLKFNQTFLFVRKTSKILKIVLCTLNEMKTKIFNSNIIAMIYVTGFYIWQQCYYTVIVSNIFVTTNMFFKFCTGFRCLELFRI